VKQRLAQLPKSHFERKIRKEAKNVQSLKDKKIDVLNSILILMVSILVLLNINFLNSKWVFCWKRHISSLATICI